MKLDLIVKRVDERHAETSIGSGLDAQFPDLVQIRLGGLRTILLPATLEGGIAAPKGVPHHEIKIAVGQPHEAPARGLDERRSRKRNTVCWNPSLHYAVDKRGQVHSRNDIKRGPLPFLVLTVSTAD